MTCSGGRAWPVDTEGPWALQSRGVHSSEPENPEIQLHFQWRVRAVKDGGAC